MPVSSVVSDNRTTLRTQTRQKLVSAGATEVEPPAIETTTSSFGLRQAVRLRRHFRACPILLLSSLHPFRGFARRSSCRYDLDSPSAEGLYRFLFRCSPTPLYARAWPLSVFVFRQLKIDCSLNGYAELGSGNP